MNARSIFWYLFQKCSLIVSPTLPFTYFSYKNTTACLLAFIFLLFCGKKRKMDASRHVVVCFRTGEDETQNKSHQKKKSSQKKTLHPSFFLFGRLFFKKLYLSFVLCCATFFFGHRIWVHWRWGPPWKRYAFHCTSYAPYMPSKETYTPLKEPYSPQVFDKSICLRQAWHLICALYVFKKALLPMKRALFAMKRALQCRGIARIDSCEMPPWYQVCCIVLQCVAVCVAVWCSECCSVLQCVLQCVAVCCSVLQCVLQCVLIHVRRHLGITWVAVCCSVLQCVLQCVAVCCSVLQCVAACVAVCVDSRETSPWYHVGCSVSQCVAVCCSVCCGVCWFTWDVSLVSRVLQCVLQCVAVCCSVCCRVWWYLWDVSLVSRGLQCVAVCCSVLQCVLQCVLIHVRRLLGITWIAVCCSVL